MEKREEGKIEAKRNGNKEKKKKRKKKMRRREKEYGPTATMILVH